MASQIKRLRPRASKHLPLGAARNQLVVQELWAPFLRAGSYQLRESYFKPFGSARGRPSQIRQIADAAQKVVILARGDIARQ